MEHLNIYLLGPPRLERNDEPLEIDTRKTIALMAYLAVTGEAHSRDALATLLWPESEPRQARAILRRNLSVLNKSLGGEGLAVDRETIGLDRKANVWLDVERFHQLAQTWQKHDHSEAEVCSDCLIDLAEAVELYRDDFLAGFSLRDSPNFDDWQSFETERLKRELAGVLEKLVQGHSAQRNFDPAIGYAQRWLTVDPLHEPAHRNLMQLYADSGDRSAALRQYQTCVRLLKEELDVPPEDETLALYDRIRTETERHRKTIANTFAIVDGDTRKGMEKNLLGQGGMGNVYRGLNTQSGEPVAIKVLKPEIVVSNPDLVERFVREGEALRQLNHPNIVKMLAASEQNGQHYLVMEYVGGGSLHDLIAKEGALPVARVLEIALDLADALTRAHRLNIIHRDLKPPNVLMAEDGTPRLTDFGLARQLEGPRTTETGVIMGTVDYLSPEGCEGQALDERADIWAFGVILFEMLTDKRPFVGETLPSTLSAIITQPVPDLTEHRSDIPASLMDLIGRMLEKELDQRIPSVRLVGAELEAIIADRPITPTTPITIPAGPPPASPYRGLFAFREEDAPFFFGREEYTRRLVEAAGQQALVAVVGSSGSGKSSVVFAGLLAQLLQESTWLIATFRPGSDPFQALAGTLLPLLEPELSETDQLVEIRKLGDRLSGGDLPLADVVERILQKNPESDRLMLVADQFEELYTLCPEPEIRHTFLDVLFEAIDLQQYQSTSSFTFVFTLRADFLEQALAHRPFSDALQDNDIKLGPMTREELGRAIEQPAEIQGVTFESGLVDRILDDVGEEPGNLPLLEFALTILWEQQQARILSHSGYEAIDRVEGALTRHADEVYGGLSQTEQEAARRIFTQLVRPGEGTEDTRRVALRSELSAEDWVLAQRLADARLVVTGQDPAGNETVEVVHEALIRSWRRLRGWMEADRTFRAWQERLRAAMRQWETTGQDKGALLRGAALAEAENWLTERGTDLRQTERDFVEASLGFRRQRQEAERAQEERERALEQSALRRLRVIVAVLVAASIVGITLTLIIFNQSQTNRRTAEENVVIASTAQAASTAAISAQSIAEEEALARATEQARAERSAAESLSLALAANARQAFDTGDGDLALALALEAVDIEQPPSEAERTLSEVVSASGTRLLLRGHSGPVRKLALHPDGRTVLSASGRDWPGEPLEDDNSLRLWDLESGQERLRFEGHRGHMVQRVFIRPDGDTVISLAHELNENNVEIASSLIAWDINNGDEIYRFKTQPEHIRYIDLTPDGRVALLGVSECDEENCHIGVAELILWDVVNGEEIRRVELDFSDNSGVWNLKVSPDGRTGFAIIINFADVDDLSSVSSDIFDFFGLLIDMQSGEVLERFAAESVLDYPVFSPDGQMIAAITEGIIIFDAETGREIRRFGVSSAGGIVHTAETDHLAFSPDGRTLLTGGSDSTLIWWDVETGRPLSLLREHNGPITDLAITADGHSALSAAEDGTLRLWNLRRGGELGPEETVRRFEGHSFRNVTHVALSPDGRFALSTTGVDETEEDGDEAILWDVEQGDIVHRFRAGFPLQAVAFSPDGSLALLGGGIDSTSFPGQLILWDVETGLEIRRFEFEKSGEVWHLTFSPDGRTAFVGTGDAIMRQIDPETGEVIRRFEGHTFCCVYGVAFSPTGRQALSSAGDGVIILWDVESGEEIRRFEHGGQAVSVTYSPDGQSFVSTSTDLSIILWDIETGEPIRRFTGHTSGVSSAAFTPDGRQLISSSADGTLILWDVETGEQIKRFTEHGTWVWKVVLSPDGRTAFSASQDGTVIARPIAPPTLEEVVGFARTTRYVPEFTCDQRATYRIEPLCDGD